MVTVPAGQTKIIEINVTNAHDGSLYYGAWYKIVAPTDKANVNIGLFSEENSTPGSGLIEEDGALHLVVGITNEDVSDALINIGVVGSIDNELNLGTTRFLIPAGWTRQVIVTDEYLEQHKVNFTEETTTTKPVDLKYTTATSNTVSLNPGTYKLEVWGAQGGSYSSGVGGKGGYSYGTLTLSQATTVYVYVGAQPTSTTGGFNGGTTTSNYGRGGGGASDVRIGSTSLYARVIVAGGGSNGYSNASPGGYGGGTSGGAGTAGTYAAGGGGTQTAGGSSYNNTGNGKFGEGGYYNTAGGGAGGGWYGGGHGYGGSVDSAGGGGSGYVYTSSTASKYPNGCLLNSSYYLTNAETIAGNTSFKNINGTSGTGNSGDGAARISGTEQVVTQVQVTGYSIPRVTGLSDLTINRGNSIDLTEGVEVQCAYNDTNCSLTKISITNTSNLELGNYTVYYTVTDGNGIKYKYARKLDVIFKLDLSGANVPILTDNLVPVMYNGTTWVIADLKNENVTYQWYGYDNKKWANAVLLTQTKRNSLTKDNEGNYIPGQTIGDTESSGVLAFYVWIPRYKYKVWNIDKIMGTQTYDKYTSPIEVIFEKGIETTGTITCSYSYSVVSENVGDTNEKCTGSNGDYYTHPAFKFGNDNLTGIWVGKFELSSSSPSITDGGGESTSLYPRILPNMTIWKKNKIDNFWQVIYNMQGSNNSYGLSTNRAIVDSHLITNMEWGAVAYLSYSKYGRCNGNVCTAMSFNSCNKYMTGCGPQSSSSTDDGELCNKYNNTLGMMASSNGNITGLYDMSGGTAEYTMGNASLSTTSYSYYPLYAGDNYNYVGYEKYLTTYAYTSNSKTQAGYNVGRLGDATSEVITASVAEGGGYYGWYGGTIIMPNSSSSWTVRGGHWFDFKITGIFGQYNATSSISSSYYTSYNSTRATLTVFPQ